MRYPDFDGRQACASVGTEVFYPEVINPPRTQINQIKRTCRSCVMQAQCLEWGLRHEPHGFWGGLSPKQRQNLRRDMGLRLVSPMIKDFLGLAS